MKSAAVAGKASDVLLVDIPDQTARARVRLVIEERDRLRKDVAALRKAFERLAPVSRLTAVQCYGDTSGVPGGETTQHAEGVQFTADERMSVRRFIDKDFLYGEGFKIDDHLGLLADGSNRIVSPIAFIRALRKVAWPDLPDATLDLKLIGPPEHEDNADPLDPDPLDLEG
jgi:hypothetical protein